MKNFVLTSFFFLALPIAGHAETSIVANLKGNARVQTSGVVHHRKSLDCYPMGKGNDYQNYGAQIVASDNSEKSLTGSGQLQWTAGISSPFTATVRRTTLTSSVLSDVRGDHVSVKIQDSFAGAVGKVHEEKCRHTDGMVVVNDATIAGNINVQYRVPENVWLLQVKRSRNEGVFNLGNTKPISTAFNAGYDLGKGSEILLWVKPGQILEQEIAIAEFVGPANLGELRMEFLPVGLNQTPSEIDAFLSNILKTSDSLKSSANEKTQEFLDKTMALVLAGEAISTYTNKITLRQLKAISDEYFRLANSVFPSAKNGHALKVASALAAFQISRAILKEMGAYCQEVDVYLPFTGETQKVLGLRAANFWLSRTMNFVDTYKYDPIEIFILELKKLQDQGMSPAAIAKNREQKERIQKAYLLLISSMSAESGPFNRAYVDFNKMAKTFPRIQSLGPKQADLLRALKEGDELQSQFVNSLSAVISQLRPANNQNINYDLLLAQMSELKLRKENVTKLMKETVRMLSVDFTEGQGQVVSQVMDLLNNQVNIFKNSVDVKYFDGIREAFYNANIKSMDSVNQGCFQLEGVN